MVFSNNLFRQTNSLTNKVIYCQFCIFKCNFFCTCQLFCWAGLYFSYIGNGLKLFIFPYTRNLNYFITYLILKVRQIGRTNNRYKRWYTYTHQTLLLNMQMNYYLSDNFTHCWYNWFIISKSWLILFTYIL